MADEGQGEDDSNSSGCSYVTLTPGDATHFPGKGYTVSVHYVGKLETDHSVFDSSHARHAPLQCKIGLGQLIRGWEEVLPKMSVHQKIRLTVPPDYGYGMNGYPPIVPANATLIYELELLGFAAP
ncbi:conserved unknown protein [Ectocarpus siliculosus]|uniref:peptidylprolyl isomerase n=1 Tax=Ectocarpus siliculosus TaxID=2880 RepID=D7FZ00_ECTSI|nr:conserved unknown protein [Ectocarpus siliculosus]|eukprot:CBJ32617.1 conserved unknown protein [Ectocarpus siliculosus]